ncbi:hypothetical protein [Scandinavium manionii]|uniref:hypothetical protein n=1 Tax=Scandinavium manionii TaxID=2926520 RepID=UPI002166A44D|nr:hypothetical protein [Scandinavium manionii]MCS2167575.1 hypothetical protein [Scandinavium manionii]
MNMTIEQITAAYPNVAKLESQAGRELLAVVLGQLNALAAENSGLKDINSWCKTDALKNMYREFKTAEALGCHDVDCIHDAMLTALMHAPETPATDAFLAEVRAQGVEMFSEHPALKLISCSHIAIEFATQLRQGAAL